jgi:1,4-alpha-glucan branching enzyme
MRHFPKWLDFPREGNGNSFHYARRQWNVVDDPILRYRFLNNFDKAMQHLEEEYNWLDSSPAWVSLKHEGDKVVVFERAGLLFVFNFHPTNSFPDYRVGVDVAGEYKIVLSSDDKHYGGFENIDVNAKFTTTPLEWNGRKNWLHVSGLSQVMIFVASLSTVRFTFLPEQA